MTSIFDKVIGFLKSDASLALTMGYVLLISLGILFNQFYYGYFDIDALAYSELTDFLVTPLRQPLILGFFVANALFFYLLSIIDEWWLRRFPKFYIFLSMGMDPNSHGYRVYKMFSYLFAGILYVVIGVQVIAQREIGKLRKAEALQVDLVLKVEKETLIQKRHVLIGKIGNFLIVKADTSRKVAIIYPMENVFEIRMVHKKAGRLK